MVSYPEGNSISNNGVYVSKINHPQSPQRHYGCDGSHYTT
jgi:hypothetical protein